MNFWVNAKTCLSQKQILRDMAKFLTHKVSAVVLAIFAKIVFRPFLTAILNLCVKHRKCVYLDNGARFQQNF